MQGAATQAMPLSIVEERRRRRRPPPRQRAWEPAAKCTTYFVTDPKIAGN